MNDFKTKRKQSKLRMKKKIEDYVDYVISDNPIFGKEIVRHFINETKVNNYESRNQQEEIYRKSIYRR